MAERIVDKAVGIVQPIVQDMGYIFVDLQYNKTNVGYVLELTIDQADGITINDCEKVSRALDELLDNADITKGQPYSFNVSSYGLDRKFSTDYDYNKHLGKEIEIRFYAPFNGKKSLTGKLHSFDTNIIAIYEENNIITIDRKQIASVSAVINFGGKNGK